MVRVKQDSPDVKILVQFYRGYSENTAILSITNQVNVGSFCEQFASLYHRNYGHNRQNGYFFMVYVHYVDTIDTKVRGGPTSCQLRISWLGVRVAPDAALSFYGKNQIRNASNFRKHFLFIMGKILLN